MMTGHLYDEVAQGYIVIDTPKQHWDYWGKDIVVVGQPVINFCLKKNGLLRYSRCTLCKRRYFR